MASVSGSSGAGDSFMLLDAVLSGSYGLGFLAAAYVASGAVLGRRRSAVFLAFTFSLTFACLVQGASFTFATIQYKHTLTSAMPFRAANAIMLYLVDIAFITAYFISFAFWTNMFWSGSNGDPPESKYVTPKRVLWASIAVFALVETITQIARSNSDDGTSGWAFVSNGFVFLVTLAFWVGAGYLYYKDGEGLGEGGTESTVTNLFAVLVFCSICVVTRSIFDLLDPSVWVFDVTASIAYYCFGELLPLAIMIGLAYMLPGGGGGGGGGGSYSIVGTSELV